MSNNHSTNPKIVRRATKGSVISTTYEFPMDRKKNNMTLRQIIYDGETGKFLGRTPKNWVEIITFYVIFYIALAALFAICMKGLLSTINDDNPKWQLDESIIGEEPGLTFRPFYPDDPHELIPLIKFATDSQEDITKWTSNLDEFLADYVKTNPNRKNCNNDTNHTVCMMDIETLGECTSDKAYGYNNSKPCVFLKLNKIYGWVPQCFNDTNDLPGDMPEDLKEHINKLEESKRNQVWVSCNAARNGTVDTPLKYSPRGFPSYFFPYLNHKGYVSPIVAVKLANPEINKMFEVECRYWAKGIEYRDSNKDRRASTIFNVLIEKKNV